MTATGCGLATARKVDVVTLAAAPTPRAACPDSATDAPPTATRPDPTHAPTRRRPATPS